MPENLTQQSCADLPKGSAPLSPTDTTRLMAQLHPDWRSSDGRLKRRFALKGYAPALMLANAAGFLAEREDHHPDIAFGWGWCEVTWWTHTVNGLSRNDFICAAKLDSLVAG